MCLHAAIILLIALTAFGVVACGICDGVPPYYPDFYESYQFEAQMTNIRNSIYYDLKAETEPKERHPFYTSFVQNQLPYFAYSPLNNRTLTNTDAKTADEFLALMQTKKESLIWRYVEQGTAAKILYYSKTTNVKDFSGDTFYLPNAHQGGGYMTATHLKDGEYILFGVPAGEELNQNSSLYSIRRDWNNYHIYYWLYIGSCAVLLALLVLTVLSRGARREGNARAAAVLVHIPLEVKLLFWLFALVVMGVSAGHFGGFEIPVIIYAAWVLLYWSAVALRHTGRATLGNNFFAYLSRTLSAREMRQPASLRLFKLTRKFFLLAVPICAGLLLVLFVITLIVFTYNAFLTLFMLACDVFTVYTLVFLLRNHARWRRIALDIGAIAQQAAAIRAGRYEPRSDVPEGSDLCATQRDLNGVGEGLNKAVAEQLHAARMRVELITNVSHDLKTPLTSILSYSELLTREQLSPADANGYAQIVHDKAKRLKLLVEDLFEVSKAESGAVQARIETLCLTDLLTQALAEFDDAFQSRRLALRVARPEEKLYVRADGAKLWRVLSNLLGNAAKYALEGTRVYISIAREGTWARFTMKNIAGYEMNFSPDEITDRFARGAASRGSEGSGLGLAIAQSFLALQGGALTVSTDGDLFKASFTLPAAEPVNPAPKPEAPTKP